MENKLKNQILFLYGKYVFYSFNKKKKINN